MNQQLAIKNLMTIFRFFPVEKIQTYKNQHIIVLNPHILRDMMVLLKYHINFQFNILTCISGSDYPSKKYRFKLVYELLSLRYNTRVQVKIHIHELMHVTSCESVFSTAEWYECEIWDLFGVFFSSHPNLKRIMTDYGFEGYPLRKDFPLSGFVETKYNEVQKRVINESVEFSQEYRTFAFLSPWNS